MLPSTRPLIFRSPLYVAKHTLVQEGQGDKNATKNLPAFSFFREIVTSIEYLSASVHGTERKNVMCKKLELRYACAKNSILERRELFDPPPPFLP